MKTKIQIPDLSILVTLASATLYIVFRNLGREAGSFAYLWAPISLIIIIYTRLSVFFKPPMRILILYGIIMVGILQFTLWKYMDNWNQPHILVEFYFLVVMTAILGYYKSRDDFKTLALLSKWTFIFIIISLITTNIALSIDPGLVRQSAATGDFTTLQRKVYKLTGAMGYGYIQSMVCLIPIIIYHIKNKKEMVFAPKILLAILLLLVITEIRSQVFANVLVTVAITTIAIIGSKKRLVSFITISSFVILITLIPNSFYVDSLSSLSTYFDQDSEMYYKLNDFAEFVNNPDIDQSTGAGARAERYPMLLDAFVASPILGNASYKNHLNIASGSHLYWMNRLALWGIFGFLFFVFVLFRIYRSIISLFDAGYKFYYFLSVLALILLGLTKAIGGTEPWLVLIVFIPGLYFLPLLEQTKKNI
jgi:hypothetical protein